MKITKLGMITIHKLPIPFNLHQISSFWETCPTGAQLFPNPILRHHLRQRSQRPGICAWDSTGHVWSWGPFARLKAQRQKPLTSRPSLTKALPLVRVLKLDFATYSNWAEENPEQKIRIDQNRSDTLRLCSTVFLHGF